jgi:hypothetical protein
MGSAFVRFLLLELALGAFARTDVGSSDAGMLYPCLLSVMQPRNLSRTLLSTASLLFHACTSCRPETSNPVVTVQIAGGEKHQIHAKLHDSAHEASAGGSLPGCRYLITLSIPSRLLSAPQRICQDSADAGCKGTANSPFEDIYDHDAYWMSLSLSISLVGSGDVKVSSTSILLARNRGRGEMREELMEGDGQGRNKGYTAPSDVYMGVHEGRVAGLKRFLFLLHVDSVWRLQEMQQRFVTDDSEVVTLVCPQPMPADEWMAYALHELEALNHPPFRRAPSASSSTFPVSPDSPDSSCTEHDSPCTLQQELASRWVHADVGHIHRRASCSHAEARKVLQVCASLRTPLRN